MKEKILLALKNKFKNLGFGDKAFEGVAEYLSASITEEDKIETGISGVEGLLKAFQGDIDKRVNEAVAKAKAESSKKDDPKEDPKENSKDDVPPWAKTLIEQNKELAEKVQGFEKENLKKSYTQKVADAMKSKGVPEKYYSKILKNSTIENDDQFNELTKELETGWQDISQDFTNQGLKNINRPFTGGGKDDKEPTKEEIDAVANEIL